MTVELGSEHTRNDVKINEISLNVKFLKFIKFHFKKSFVDLFFLHDTNLSCQQSTSGETHRTSVPEHANVKMR